ncbi:McrB family protein [Spirillospora sp. NPDC048911]|uniref:McrB family protein n=1 Tax=Spirillospora sp. NPDC048911 TaxID=3364527 RepID=UPI00371F2CFF
MVTWVEAISKAQRAGLRILLDRPEGVRARELWPMVTDALPGIEAETAAAVDGGTTPYKYFQWRSVELVKAGWLTKQDGRWFVTPVGRTALKRHPDPEGFYREAGTSYKYWKQNREGFGLAKRLVESVPEGTWISIEDLADQTGLSEQNLVHWLQGERPEGWYRVLDPDGGLPDAVDADGATRDEWYRLLDDDGVTMVMDMAPHERKMPAPDLRQLAFEDAGEDSLPEERPRRAWLVRGTSARDDDLVQDWLDGGYCSLPASRLRELAPGVSREVVRKAVEEDYDAATYGERTRRTTEFYAFLSQLRIGDLVLTIDDGDAHLGEVASDAGFVASQDSRANLQRRVSWHERNPPYDVVADLPDELAAKISTQHDVLDLTEFLHELEELEAGGKAETAEAVLPAPTEELAEKVLVDLPWLEECVELLRDRPQLIFYGPPGTGKTYLAQELAQHLAGGRKENVKLVQFHPAYTYEDFFQGFRPVESKEGMGVGFSLKDGPLRRMVTAAKEHKNRPYVLIIDEINRGNLAKIFGELYFLLEYRDKAVDLVYASESELADQAFTLPRNLFIIGTMNTADRSIALVDAAMRRRFAFLELHPAEEPTSLFLEKWLKKKELPGEAALLLAELNRRIEDRDFKVGPSYLMRERIYADPKGLERVWRTQIIPLLQEHHYGDGTDVEGRYGPAALRLALA